MAIKSGQILHDANGFVVDRIQTGGVSNLNIPEEKVYELGNYQTVATVRDIPELSFEVESTDVSTEVEALLTGNTPTLTTAGQEFDFADHMPIDIISPFKSRTGAFDIVKGISVPYLTLETATYRFGVRQNSTQSFTLRGDSVYYIPGSPYYMDIPLANNVLTYNFSQTAMQYVESGNTIYALSACVKNPATKAYKRLFFSSTSADGYTNSATQITVNTDWFDEGYTRLHVTFGSTAAASYPQTVHQTTAVKPAAVRAKDVCVYVSDGASTPTLGRWAGVQSFEVTRQVNLENDEEFCNTKFVGTDYDTADVTGSIGVKSVDPDDLFDKVAQIASVPTNEVVGPFSSEPLEVEVQVNDPDSGDTVKTLYVSDARFTIPAIQGRVQTKLETTFNFTSDGGNLLIYQGERP